MTSPLVAAPLSCAPIHFPRCAEEENQGRFTRFFLQEGWTPAFAGDAYPEGTLL